MATSKKIKELRAEWLRLWKKSHEKNKGSKWYESDIKVQTEGINKCTDIERMERCINNLKWMDSKASEEYERREMDKMARAGMFNIGKMGPKNALD